MEDLPFKVEQWDESSLRIIRTLATADNLLVARAAYREAARLYPKANVTLSQRAHLIEKQNHPDIDCS